MNKTLSRFQQFGRKLGALRGIRPAFREISVIGPDQDRVNNLVGAFLNAETDGANILQSDDPLAVRLRKNQRQELGSVQGSSFYAHYLSSGRAGKSRRFRFHLPPTTDNEENGEKSLWQFATDVMILDWPYQRMTQSTTESLDDIFHLGGNLCRARDRGRLKRAALVVSGIPDHLAPHHKSQLTLTFRQKESFQEGLQRQLREGAELCGHPIADPSWRNFLHKEVMSSPSLARLYETTRLSLGRPIPVVFLPEHPLRKACAASLLDWIAHTRKGSGSRREKMVTIVNVFGVITMTILAFVFGQLSWAQSPLSENLNQEQPAVFDTTQISLNRINVKMEERINRQGSFPLNSLQWLLRLQDAAAPLETAREEIKIARGKWEQDELSGRNRQDFIAWSELIAERIEQDFEHLKANQKEGLNHSDTTGCENVEAYLTQFGTWNRIAGAEKIPDESLANFDKSLEAAAWISALSTLRFVLREDGLRYRFQADEVIVKPLTGHLTSAGFFDLVDQIETLFESETYREFLEKFSNFMQDGSEATRLALRNCVTLLPEINVQTILDEIENSSLRYNSDNRSLQRSRLEDIRFARNIEHIGNRIITNQQDLAAATLLDDLNAALASHPMIIHISSSEPHWHFHIAPGKNKPYSAVPWDVDGEDYCELRESLRPFRGIYLKLCDNRKQPADVGQGMCGTGKRAIRVVLKDPDQVVRVDGKDFRFEVTSGWPDWPPEH